MLFPPTDLKLVSFGKRLCVQKQALALCFPNHPLHLLLLLILIPNQHQQETSEGKQPELWESHHQHLQKS